MFSPFPIRMPTFSCSAFVAPPAPMASSSLALTGSLRQTWSTVRFAAVRRVIRSTPATGTPPHTSGPPSSYATAAIHSCVAVSAAADGAAFSVFWRCQRWALIRKMKDGKNPEKIQRLRLRLSPSMSYVWMKNVRAATEGTLTLERWRWRYDDEEYQMRGNKGVMVMALFPAHFSTYLVPLNTIRLVFSRCLFPHKKKKNYKKEMRGKKSSGSKRL